MGQILQANRIQRIHRRRCRLASSAAGVLSLPLAAQNLILPLDNQQNYSIPMLFQASQEEFETGCRAA